MFCLYGTAEKELLVGRRDFDSFVQQARYYFSRDIIKEPSFVWFYDELAQRFPNADQVFIVRDPVQNVRSILDRLNLPGDRRHLEDRHWEHVQEESSNWKIILEGTLYGHEGDDYIETLARRWKMSAQLYLSDRDTFEAIKYETFNQDKEAEIYGLAQRLGLQVSNDISDQVNVQYQPKGQRDADAESFFGTRNVTKIREICRPEMEALGYE
jgi:hypothetical protein